MWMCDKALIQVGHSKLMKNIFNKKILFNFFKEELSTRISNLVGCFKKNDSQVMLFVKVYFITIIREWNGIDKWRIDKFMMVSNNRSPEL